MTGFDWQKADHQIVRELGWSLFSPPILHFDLDGSSAPWSPRLDEESQWLLRKLEDNPSQLSDRLEVLNDRRLGARFEGVWRYFLEQHSFYEVLAANLQIFDTGKTLGALDFLIYDGYQNSTIHLEIAVKFYLYCPPGPPSNLSCWIGPNTDDNLLTKFDHLRSHQLPLSTRPETLRFLKEKELPIPKSRVALVMGYLFSPFENPVTPLSPVNSHHLRGTWIKCSSLKMFLQGDSTDWYVLPRTNWLDPTPHVRGHMPAQYDMVSRFVSDEREPVMLVANGAQPHAEHSCRLFVVPDDWCYRH